MIIVMGEVTVFKGVTTMRFSCRCLNVFFELGPWAQGQVVFLFRKVLGVLWWMLRQR
jgi:hypothetical protein